MYICSMKRILSFTVLAMAVAALASCSKINNPENEKSNPDAVVDDGENPAGYFGYAQMSVPAATKTVYIEYTNSDGHTTVLPVDVEPQVTAPEGGRDVEPFGTVNLLLNAPRATKVNVYYNTGAPATRAEGSQAQIYLLSGFPIDHIRSVDEHGTIIVDYEEYNASSITLPDPAKYLSKQGDQTFYHSSGVVMFEDSWPTITQGGVYDTDFDDVVIDYDFEAKVMPDSMLESDGTREQVKVVLHLRAVGSGTPNRPSRVGVRMEGFDQQYINNVEEYFTLDSYNNPHGTLPAFTQTTIQHNSAVYTQDTKNPVVEMAHIFTLNQERAGVGDDAVYTYFNGNGSNTTVFNLTYGFKPQDKSQYDPELETMDLPYPFKNIVKQKYYNCIPGYMNVAGGLITYTVIFNMKSRAKMDSEAREKAKQNMIEAVINTTAQNFYIINGDFTPIGLKGYSPVLIHKESESKFNAKLAEAIGNGNIADANNPYAGANGMVWGFKCPTLTKHVWNKLYFSQAYPLYEGWVLSNGASNADWYYTDVDERFLVCEW